MRLRHGYRKRSSRTRTHKKVVSKMPLSRRQNVSKVAFEGGKPTELRSVGILYGRQLPTLQSPYSLQSNGFNKVLLTSVGSAVSGVQLPSAHSQLRRCSGSAIHCCYCAIIMYAFRLRLTFSFHLLFVCRTLYQRQGISPMDPLHLHTHVYIYISVYVSMGTTYFLW